MRLIMVPDFLHWLESEKVAVYLYKKNFEEARHEPFVVVHTSGSTGTSQKLMSVDHNY